MSSACIPPVEAAVTLDGCSYIYSCAVAPDATRLLINGVKQDGNHVYVATLEQNIPTATIVELKDQNRFHGLLWLTNERLLRVVGRSVERFAIDTSKSEKIMALPARTLSAHAVFANGTKFILATNDLPEGTEDKMLHLCDAVDGKLFATIPTDSYSILKVSVSDDGAVIGIRDEERKSYLFGRIVTNSSREAVYDRHPIDKLLFDNDVQDSQSRGDVAVSASGTLGAYLVGNTVYVFSIQKRNQHSKPTGNVTENDLSGESLTIRRSATIKLTIKADESNRGELRWDSQDLYVLSSRVFLISFDGSSWRVKRQWCIPKQPAKLHNYALSNRRLIIWDENRVVVYLLQDTR